MALPKGSGFPLYLFFGFFKMVFLTINSISQLKTNQNTIKKKDVASILNANNNTRYISLNN